MPTELSEALPISLPRHKIDPDAAAVCRRLQEAGYETYLVGGCVRDIILGRTPKDFDVGTAATPNQVRRVFRNCRLIGRRFRLAHVHFGPKVIEVATFRGGTGCEDDEGFVSSGSEEIVQDDSLIVRANNFGTPAQDAVSRDFTINALFYDPIGQQLIDHVSGYKDIRAGIVRTIGAAVTRFREDPVRILRAVKFAARLGFELEQETLEATREVAPDILRCPIPRVTEEVYRVAESCHASAAFDLMHQNGVLAVVLPELSEWMDRHGPAYLEHLRRLDQLGMAHRGLPREFVLSLLFYPLALGHVLDLELPPGPGWGGPIEEWFRPVGVRMHVAVRHRNRLRALMALLGRMLAPPRKKRKTSLSVADCRVLPQALTLLRMKARENGHGPQEGGLLHSAYERWRDRADEADVTWVPISDGSNEDDPDDRSRSRRRRRGRRRS